MKKEKKTKILVINFGGIGDEILFFPTLKSLYEMFKNPHITLVCEPRSVGAALLTNYIDDVITCDIKGKYKFFEILKFLFKAWFGRYEFVISSGSSKFIPVLLFLTGIKRRVGYDSGKYSYLLTKSIELDKYQYAANMYHDLAKAIKNKAECEIPKIDITSDDLRQAAEMIGERDKQIILIHPGVSLMSTKKRIYKGWKVQSWVDLIKTLLCTGKYKVLLTGGPDDEEVIKEIREQLTKTDACLNNLKDLYGKTKSITQLAGLIELCDLMISVDSAPMHIAVGTKTELVVLFGPTDERKLLPKDERFSVIKNESITCRPCLWDKRSSNCAKNKCLNIHVEQVLDVVNSKLSS